MTPTLAYVRVEWHGGRRIGLWLPLFLLWIPLVLLSPLIVLVVAAVCAVGRVNAWRTIATLWGLMVSLPGTDVRVCADGNRVTVRIV
ncbi:MAG TPA: hypothetical protein VND90_14395 [Terracidiphilus sp.]|nr:hypothetical protein [Terracidiphilus sp.]